MRGYPMHHNTVFHGSTAITLAGMVTWLQEFVRDPHIADALRGLGVAAIYLCTVLLWRKIRKIERWSVAPGAPAPPMLEPSVQPVPTPVEIPELPNLPELPTIPPRASGKP